MCYRDMTFCPFWKECKEGDTCFRSMTEDVINKANDIGLGISQFMEHPDCFKERENKKNKEK